MASRCYKRVCVSGFFDPFHVGHCEYLKDAHKLGDQLIVILNNDSQRSHIRIPQEERKVILESIRYVDKVIISEDKGSSVSNTLRTIQPDIFAKGLSASPEEVQVCEELDIQVVTNVGRKIHLHDILNEFR